MPVFLLAGNTSVKAAAPGRPMTVFPADVEAGPLASFLRQFPHETCAAASVNPSAAETMEEACRRASVAAPLYASRDFPHNVPFAAESLQTAGIDRILNVKAAFSLSAAPCAAVDFGTAVSISVADAAGRFTGGSILPGLALGMRALHDRTAFLPTLSPAVPDSPLGRDTAAAMQSGAVYGSLGAVKEVLARISAVLDAPLGVFLTGGDCELVGAVAPVDWRVTPELTLEGLRLAYEESRS